MTKLLSVMVLALIVSGCSMTDIPLLTKKPNKSVNGPALMPANQPGSYGNNGGANGQLTSAAATPDPSGSLASMDQDLPLDPMYMAKDRAPVDLSRFYGKPTDKNITHYVRGIMHDLVDNLHYVNETTPIGVTSFVFVDGAFDQANLLANQIAESFIHEVHQFGIPVIDYKTTDYIRVTPAGDFIFSRDYLELKENQPIKYVLAGTLAKHRAGYIVNARIIGLLSKAVVASAQGFIPYDVAEGLVPSGTNGTVGLTQG